MNTPLISFIIPIFNTAKYLAECLDSILRQSIDKELILIDDCSTDDSLMIALDYAKRYPFITVIHQSHNQGPSASKNRGIALAKGEYLYFVDSDDYLFDEDLYQAYLAAKESNADVVKMQVELFYDQDPSKTHRYSATDRQVSGQQGVIYRSYELFVRQTHTRWIPSICWSLIRRNYIEEYQLRFKNGLKAEDQIFYIELLTATNTLTILELPITIYRYRQREYSITTTKNDMSYILDIIQVINWIEQYRHQDHFPNDVKQGFIYILKHLEFSVNRHFGRMEIDLQKEYKDLLINP